MGMEYKEFDKESIERRRRGRGEKDMRMREREVWKEGLKAWEIESG